MSVPVVLERLPGNPADLSGLKSRQIKRQRVYIFPTIQGWLYGLMLIVMLLGAINYNNSMAFMLCFLLTSLGIVCMLYTYRNLTGLIITSSKPKSVFAGQQALFPVLLDNRFGVERFSITLQQKKRKKDFFKAQPIHNCISNSVSASKQVTMYYPIHTSNRGILKLERIVIATSFPLGIFRAWSYFEANETCIVYPSPQGQKQLPVTTLYEEDRDYGIKSGVDDFAGFRKYRAGDPINTIAWKAFAREQGLLIKQFSGKGSQTLILDWNSVANIGDIELRLSQLCYWVLIAEQIGIEYGLEIPGNVISPNHGMKHKESCLEALARYGLINEQT